MERLTKPYWNNCYAKADKKITDVQIRHKLGKLEDILEHYGVVDLDDLKGRLKTLNIICFHKVDLWLLENCNYENYIRIRKEAMIENKTCDGVDLEISEKEFNYLKYGKEELEK